MSRVRFFDAKAGTTEKQFKQITSGEDAGYIDAETSGSPYKIEYNDNQEYVIGSLGNANRSNMVNEGNQFGGYKFHVAIGKVENEQDNIDNFAKACAAIHEMADMPEHSRIEFRYKCNHPKTQSTREGTEITIYVPGSDEFTSREEAAKAWLNFFNDLQTKLDEKGVPAGTRTASDKPFFAGNHLSYRMGPQGCIQPEMGVVSCDMSGQPMHDPKAFYAYIDGDTEYNPLGFYDILEHVHLRNLQDRESKDSVGDAGYVSQRLGELDAQRIKLDNSMVLRRSDSISSSGTTEFSVDNKEHPKTLLQKISSCLSCFCCLSNGK